MNNQSERTGLKISNNIWYVVTGATLGLVGSAIAYFQAQAAVNVRPELANVGFIDAALTNHGIDWVFYHQPIVGTILVLAFWIVVVTLGGRWLQ